MKPLSFMFYYSAHLQFSDQEFMHSGLNQLAFKQF